MLIFFGTKRQQLGERQRTFRRAHAQHALAARQQIAQQQHLGERSTRRVASEGDLRKPMVMAQVTARNGMNMMK